MRYQRSVILAIAALLLGSCTWQQQQQKHGESDGEAGKVAENPPLCLGAVHQVYPEQNFVLLRIIGPMPAPGTTLITHPPDGSVSRLGNIRVTTEKATRNGIVAADVRAGTVLRGDRVFLYRDISSHSPKEEENPEPADTQPEIEPTMQPDGGQADVPGNPVTDNEHPRITNTPVRASDGDIPDPVAADSEDDTTVEQDPNAGEATGAPGSIPLPSGSPGTAPSYLDEIPDNIDGWN